LGVTKDRLNELRENNIVRAYRDGAGWKFRVEDIEKLSNEGIPPEGSSSELSLEDASDESADMPVGSMSDISLDLGDEEEITSAAPSDLSLEDLDEPTVPVDAPADGDELELTARDDGDDMSDSILLSEAELGESTDRPPSTIIGKAEMGADLDLELASGQSSSSAGSDVKLAPTTSNIFSTGSRDDVLEGEPPSLEDNFGGLEELEIDLEAESSRILSPEDVSKAQAAAKQTAPKAPAPKAPEMSDLELAPSDSQAAPSAAGPASDIITGSSGGLSGLSALELEASDVDDDEVLGEGSDITLSSESSGINIISPSDSGLALDEVSLELSGASAMGSSLDLGSAVGAGEAELAPLEVAEDEEGKGAEPFTLTPFGEEAQEEEEDSSQVIPLDEVAEEEAGGSFLGAAEEAGAMHDDFGAVSLAAGAAPTGELAYETPFTTWHIVGLTMCMLLLAMCGMMVFDIMRNIWSWDGTYTASSTLLQVLNPFLK